MYHNHLIYTSISLTGKLQEGVEVDRVLNDIRDSAVVGHIKRVHLLERKDILNIKQSLDQLNIENEYHYITKHS